MNEKLERFLTVKNFVRIIGVFIAGLLALVGIVLFMIPASQKAKCTEKVTATVTGFAVHDGDSGETYAPIFEYTYNGMEYRSSSKVYARPSEFEEGEITEICIDPDSPHDVYVPTEKTMYIVSVVLFVWAAIVFVMLVFVFPAMLKIKPKEELVSYTENPNEKRNM